MAGVVDEEADAHGFKKPGKLAGDDDLVAGHQAMQVTEGQGRALGIAVFSAIAIAPAIAPAVIETAHAGACASMKESTERFMKKNGRWMSAAILLAAAGYVAWNAWKNIP